MTYNLDKELKNILAFYFILIRISCCRIKWDFIYNLYWLSYEEQELDFFEVVRRRDKMAFVFFLFANNKSSLYVILQAYLNDVNS